MQMDQLTVGAWITFSQDKDRPLAVFARLADGSLGQEVMCNCLRDARIYANGMLMGAMYGRRTGDPAVAVNPEVDPRMVHEN